MADDMIDRSGWRLVACDIPDDAARAEIEQLMSEIEAVRRTDTVYAVPPGRWTKGVREAFQAAIAKGGRAYLWWLDAEDGTLNERKL